MNCKVNQFSRLQTIKINPQNQSKSKKEKILPLGLTDNASVNPASNFTSVKNVFTLDNTCGTVTSVISGGEWTKIPATTLQFATTANYKTGPDSSASEVQENLTDYEINGAEYRDVLSLGTYKLRKSIFGDEAFKLDYVLEDGIVGSINYYRTIKDVYTRLI